MAALKCEKCSAALALADTLCQACGTPVPRAHQAELYLKRAGIAADAGQFNEAVRQLERAIGCFDDPAQGQPWLKKLGLWLEKEPAPGDEEKAEAAFLRARELEDKDELAHQLWINHLVRRGLDGRAEKYYQERLGKDALDSVASRQLSVLKLAREFKAQPVKVTLDLGTPHGFFAKALTPTPMKIMVVGVNTVFSGVLTLLFFFTQPGEQAVSELDPALQGLGPALSLGPLTHPTSWAVSTLLSGVLWGWMWRNRR